MQNFSLNSVYNIVCDNTTIKNQETFFDIKTRKHFLTSLSLDLYIEKMGIKKIPKETT